MTTMPLEWIITKSISFFDSIHIYIAMFGNADLGDLGCSGNIYIAQDPYS